MRRAEGEAVRPIGAEGNPEAMKPAHPGGRGIAGGTLSSATSFAVVESIVIAALGFLQVDSVFEAVKGTQSIHREWRCVTPSVLGR